MPLLSILTLSSFLQCEPLTGRVQKILTWRWKEPPAVDDDEMDHVTPHSPNKKLAELQREREFFVKWHDMCYWHSEWISELQVGLGSGDELKVKVGIDVNIRGMFCKCVNTRCRCQF